MIEGIATILGMDAINEVIFLAYLAFISIKEMFILIYLIINKINK